MKRGGNIFSFVPAPLATTFPLGLAARRWGGTGGPPIVLLHGGTGSWTHWIRNIVFLSERFTVTAFDLPGFGTAGDVAAGIGHEEYFRWVAAALAETLEGARFHLAGFSFGSVIGLEVAYLLSSQIRGLSLISPAGLGKPDGRLIELRKLPAGDTEEIREVLAYNLGRSMLAQTPPTSDPVVDLHLSNIRAARFDSRPISWRATATERLPAVQCPVQIIWGGQDALAFPSVQTRVDFIRRLRPDAQCHVVAAAGHWVQYDDAAAVNRMLLDFHGQGRTR